MSLAGQAMARALAAVSQSGCWQRLVNRYFRLLSSSASSGSFRTWACKVNIPATGLGFRARVTARRTTWDCRCPFRCVKIKNGPDQARGARPGDPNNITWQCRVLGIQLRQPPLLCLLPKVIQCLRRGPYKCPLFGHETGGSKKLVTQRELES